MFIKINEELFRIVYKNDRYAWAISYEDPKSPKCISLENLKEYEKVEVPNEYLMKGEDRKDLTAAQKEKLNLIQPLLEDEKFVYHKKERNSKVKEIAIQNKTTQKRILRLYYTYLAKKELSGGKPYKNKKNETYESYRWAIKKYYYSAKQVTLRDTYDLMILNQYMTPEGLLAENYPSWYSFKHFFYDHNFNQSTQKDISRNGLSWYQRNARPIMGDAVSWKNGIGHYQIDATLGDIYLVSKIDKSIVIGRPNIYMAVDTRTQLIAGIYVGLSADETAVMRCLSNAAENKVEFCKKYGIEMKEEQWPSKGLPQTIITDQGKEFVGKRVEELCLKFGMEIENLPPFRPDQKSLIEKSFDLLQDRYKPLLRGKGIIEEDAKERWAVDYRKQAVLNLEEFTAIIIHCILYMNSGRILENYQLTANMIQDNLVAIAAKLWAWFEQQQDTQLIPVNERDLYYLSLSRKKAYMDRKGIKHNGLWYKNKDIMNLISKVKNYKNVMIAYDVSDISTIYFILNTEYIPFTLSASSQMYYGVSELEQKLVKEKIKTKYKECRETEIQSRMKLLSEIQKIIDTTDSNEPTIGKDEMSGSYIKNNKERERNLLL